MSRHTPRASFPAFSDHDGELVQSVGLQTRHHVTQVGSVGRLKANPRNELRYQRREKKKNFFLQFCLYFASKANTTLIPKKLGYCVNK